MQNQSPLISLGGKKKTKEKRTPKTNVLICKLSLSRAAWRRRGDVKVEESGLMRSSRVVPLKLSSQRDSGTDVPVCSGRTLLLPPVSHTQPHARPPRVSASLPLLNASSVPSSLHVYSQRLIGSTSASSSPPLLCREMLRYSAGLMWSMRNGSHLLPSALLHLNAGLIHRNISKEL